MKIEDLLPQSAAYDRRDASSSLNLCLQRVGPSRPCMPVTSVSLPVQDFLMVSLGVRSASYILLAGSKVGGQDRGRRGWRSHIERRERFSNELTVVYSTGEVASTEVILPPVPLVISLTAKSAM